MPHFEAASDRSAFLADFSSEVTGDFCFKAIFDREYVEYEDMQGNKPVLTAPYVWPVTALIEKTINVDGSALTVERVNYEVVRVELDGTGWALIILEEQ